MLRSLFFLSLELLLNLSLPLSTYKMRPSLKKLHDTIKISYLWRAWRGSRIGHDSAARPPNPRTRTPAGARGGAPSHPGLPLSPAVGYAARRVLLCYITDRLQLQGGLLARIEDALRAGVDLIQIREKDLSGRDLHALCSEALRLPNPHGTKILVNARADVALAVGAHGTHLPSNAPAPSDFRGIAPAEFLIGVSCHSLEDVRRAQAEGADYVVFGPVFETPSKQTYGPSQGVERLRQACEAADLPVLALGGVTRDNAASCVQAGAAGIAGISLFQKAGDLQNAEHLAAAVRALRGFELR